MATLEYLQLDVFTSTRFEGNQLAVFLDARGVDASLMQTIAREMNFSESTFVLPAERSDTDVRMRIFTPGAELPMAGHPTIGTTFALASTGRIASSHDHFVFGLGVGPTRVELVWAEQDLAFAWMDQRPPDTREPASSVADILRAAGVAPDAHART
jgi:trans-2,3-dihydro-3-hydroxyanthranilate isomerase